MIVTITGDGSSYQISTITESGLTYNFSNNPIFELEVLNNTDLSISYIDASDFTNSICKVDSNNNLKISFYGQTVLDGLIKVHVTGTAGENSEADLGIDVMFKVSGYSLKAVKFPKFTVANLAGSNTEQVMLVPATKVGGSYHRGPASGTSYKTYNYPGTMGMQYVSLMNYSGGQQLFVQAVDPQAHLKDFYYAGSNPATHVHMVWTHYPINGDEPLVSFYTPYKMRLGAITSGDWYDAAHKYKEWATGQTWATYRGKTYTNSNSLHSSGALRARLSLLQAPSYTTSSTYFSELKDDMDGLRSTLLAAFGANIPANETTTIWYDWHNARSTTFYSGTSWPDWTEDGGVLEGLYDVISEARSEGYVIAPYTYDFTQYPTRSMTWSDANSFNLSFVKNYVNESLLTVSETIEASNEANGADAELYELIDAQRPEFSDSLFNLYSGALISGAFNGFYYDVYPSEVPINYNPSVSQKGGSPVSHMSFAEHHNRIKSFATGYLSGDFMHFSEYSNEISLMDIDLPNYYRAERQSGDYVVNSTSGITTLPLMSVAYHEYGRFGCYDYFATGQDLARIYHEGAIPGWLALHNVDFPGTPVIGNILPSYYVDSVAYAGCATDVLRTYASFVSSSGASDKYLIYGSKLRPVSGSREWNAIRSDLPPTGGEIQVSTWKSQDNKIGVIASCCSVTGSFNVVLPTGMYLTSGTVYSGYIASGAGGGTFGFQSTGLFTGYYNGTLTLDQPYMVKILEFRP